MTSKKRVYYHETVDVCDGLPDLLHRFPLRALLVAKPGERVVLPEGSVPAELPLLNHLGFGPRPEDIVYARPDGTIAAGDNNLEGAEVLPFSGTTQRARLFAEKNGCAFDAPDRDTCLAANSKATFQEILALSGFDEPVLGPDGFVTTRDDAERGVKNFFAETACEKVVIKGVHSASGLQQKVVARGEPVSVADLPQDLVVQEFVEHDYSASVLVRTDLVFSSTVLAASAQILDGNHHIGNLYPLPQNDGRLLESLGAIGRLLGDEIADLGYWGFLGVDFLVKVRENGVHEALANEVNARIPAPWYPWNASRRRLGRPLPFRMKSLKLRPGATIDDIERVMAGLLFNPHRQQGFVPFCFVPEHDFVYGVTFAPSPFLLDAEIKVVDDRLKELQPKT